MEQLHRYLTDFNVVSGTLRLILAMVCGGIIGYDRGKKRRPAGMRTYMMVCVGAALSILLAEFQDAAFKAILPELANVNPRGNHIDVSRFGAKVINGIGFLGAGTIIVTANQQVKGITTAAGLFASACMGFAIGAGFYEVAIIGCLLMWVTMSEFTYVEKFITNRTRNMNVYVELEDIDDVGSVINAIKNEGIRIYDVEVQRGSASGQSSSGAILSLQLPRRQHHAVVASKIADIDEVLLIEEI